MKTSSRKNDLMETAMIDKEHRTQRSKVRTDKQQTSKYEEIGE
jgi:hypothetical protein